MPELVESLPALQRLALAYAPRRAHGPMLALLALDNRLAGVVRNASDPMMAQIRIAWWREILAQDQAHWPNGEPLLAALRNWRECAGDLVPLADGWEHLVGADLLDKEAIEAFVGGRANAFAALARVLGHQASTATAERLGRGWALADLAWRLQSPDEKEIAGQLIVSADWSRASLPRDLRPLAVLFGLAARSVRKGKDLGALSPTALVPAMRIGLLGF